MSKLLSAIEKAETIAIGGRLHRFLYGIVPVHKKELFGQTGLCLCGRDTGCF